MIVVYGGSFNPPTIAHLNIANEIVSAVKPKKFIFMPVGNVYNKKDLVSEGKRIEMLSILKKAINEEQTEVLISDFEAKNEKFLGTIETLNFISKKYNDDVSFVIGADNLLDIKNWIRVDELLTKYKIIVLGRNNVDISTEINKNKLLNKYAKQFIYLDNVEEMDVSSSLFRKERDRKTVIDEIYKYIEKNHLYGL